MKKNDAFLTEIATKIRRVEKQGVSNVIKIGGWLKQVQDRLEHGDFKAWVAHEFGWSYRTSVRYRAAHNLADRCQRGTFARLNISITALYALADLDDDEATIRDAIIASGLDGQRLTATSVRDAIWTKRTEREDAEAHDDDDDEADEADDSKDTDDDEAEDPTDDSDDPTPEDDTDDDPAPDDEKIVRPNELARLLAQLRDFAFDDPAWSRAIAVVGTASIGELVKTFERVLSHHQASKADAAVKAAADRAEAHAQRKGKAQ